MQPPLVLALAELAQVLGVTKHRAMQILQKPGFPEPVAHLSVGRVWLYDAVVDFCEATGRRVHPLAPAEGGTVE